MRTKLFFAFLAVIATALISNLLFERFISSDFEDYVRGAKEDKLYWILASVEGSYKDGQWDVHALHDAVHWAIMLGFDVRVTDAADRELINSAEVMSMLSPPMKRKMESIVDFGSATGEFEPYPLYYRGAEIGTMHTRLMKKIGSIKEKETLFKKRGKDFLLMSFIIAGGGAVLLAAFFILFLSRPLKRLKTGVESLAKGDLSVRVPVKSRKDELGRLARSFNYMAEALQREEALRKHLTSNIAHELRTPLAVMKANVEGMIDGVVEDRGKGLENIRTEVDNLIKLVEGIEDITKAEASFFSRRESGELTLQPFLLMAVSKLMPLAAGKGLKMHVRPGGTITVFTDIGKLEKIVQNILTNAIKYTESGEIIVNYGKDKHTFFIEVKDTGRGIPEEKSRMVFQRFYRGDESEGLGLGLAIVKELVDVMGGSIELESTVGKGSTFRLRLPLQEVD